MNATTREHPTRTRFGPWSPAQFVVGAVGVFLTVLGGVALARTGIGDWTSPTTSVLGFGHTPLFAVVEILMGVVIMSDTARPYLARRSLASTGVLFLAFGLITWIEPGAFDQWLGVTAATGALYSTLGIGAILIGSVSPILGPRA